MARHARSPKLESKPGWLKRQTETKVIQKNILSWLRAQLRWILGIDCMSRLGGSVAITPPMATFDEFYVGDDIIEKENWWVAILQSRSSEKNFAQTRTAFSEQNLNSITLSCSTMALINLLRSCRVIFTDLLVLTDYPDAVSPLRLFLSLGHQGHLSTSSFSTLNTKNLATFKKLTVHKSLWLSISSMIMASLSISYAKFKAAMLNLLRTLGDILWS